MSELKTRVTVDSTQVTSNLNGLRGYVKNWAGDIRGQIIGAFAAGALVNAGKGVADRLSAIGDAASRQDFGAESMQSLVLMARNASLELGNVEKLLNSFSDAQLELITDPTSKNSKALQGIGISQKAANQMTPEEFMKAVVAGLNKNHITGREQIQNALPFLSSKLSGVLNSLLGDLTEFDKKVKEFKASGAVVDEQQVANSKKAQDELTLSWESFKNKIAPISTAILRHFNDIISTLKWSGSNLSAVFDFVIAEIQQPYAHFLNSVNLADRLKANLIKLTNEVRWNHEDAPLNKPTPPNLPIKPAAHIPSNGVSDFFGGIVGMFDDKIKKIKPHSIYTDELLAKGNILGQSRNGGTVNYALEQLKLQRQTVVQIQEVGKKIDRVIDVIGTLSLFKGLIP